MRLMRVTIAPELVVHMLTGGRQIAACEITEGLPADARLVSAELDTASLLAPEAKVLALVFEHDSFPEMLPFEPAAALRILIRNARRG